MPIHCPDGLTLGATSHVEDVAIRKPISLKKKKKKEKKEGLPEVIVC